MKKYLISALLCLITIIIPLVSFAKSNDELIFAIDLIRHGDRTPMVELAKSTYHWQEGLGELTKQGQQQAFQLGSQLKYKYINQYKLLPDHASTETIYVRATDNARTIATAKAILQAIYPNTAITIHTLPKSEDNSLIVKPSKNIFNLIKLYRLNSKIWKEETTGLQNEIKSWSESSGMKIQNFQQLDQLADNLYIRKLHHVPFPEGMTSVDVNKILSLAEKSMIIAFKQPQITYPMGHEFLTNVATYFQKAMESRKPLKYVLFLAHDSSIMAVMNTLKAPLDEIPAYTSHMNFSLFKNGEQYFIKIFYNDRPVKISECNNSNICTWNQFSRLVNN